MAFAKCLAGVTITACLVGGCAKQESSNYCDDHYLFHESHANKIGKLDIVFSEDGYLVAAFSLPRSIFDGQGEASGAAIDEVVGILNDSESVFTIQAAATCAEIDVSVMSKAGLLSARYEVDCSVNNKIGQLDILLFESIAAVEEVEVVVKTPAANKQFVISRQCDSTIFRFWDKSSD